MIRRDPNLVMVEWIADESHSERLSLVRQRLKSIAEYR